MMAAALLYPAPSAQAADMGWPMINSTPYKIVFKFFSRSRNAVWPGAGQVWYVWPGQKYTPVLRCQDGEYICYGAWVEGRPDINWGVGPSGNLGCPSCCYTCQFGKVAGHRLIYTPQR